MKKYGILVIAFWYSVYCTSCATSQDLPKSVTEEAPTGDMGGGTGSGTVGDDPTNP